MYFECRLLASFSGRRAWTAWRPCLRRCLLTAQRTAWRACFRDVCRGLLLDQRQLQALAGATPTLATEVATSPSAASSIAATPMATALCSIRRAAAPPATPAPGEWAVRSA